MNIRGEKKPKRKEKKEREREREKKISNKDFLGSVRSKRSGWVRTEHSTPISRPISDYELLDPIDRISANYLPTRSSLQLKIIKNNG